MIFLENILPAFLASFTIIFFMFAPIWEYGAHKKYFFLKPLNVLLISIGIFTIVNFLYADGLARAAKTDSGGFVACTSPTSHGSLLGPTGIDLFELYSSYGQYDPNSLQCFKTRISNFDTPRQLYEMVLLNSVLYGFFCAVFSILIRFLASKVREPKGVVIVDAPPAGAEPPRFE